MENSTPASKTSLSTSLNPSSSLSSLKPTTTTTTTTTSNDQVLAYQLKQDLNSLKSKLHALLEQNQHAPEAEKLTPEECLLNGYHLKQLQAIAFQKVTQTKESMLQERQRTQLEMDHIIATCWNPMEVQGKTLVSLISELSVSNYPILSASSSQLKTYLQIITLRQAQEEGSNAPYFFHPLQLITRERQQIQLVLLEKQMELWKRDFNAKFETMLKFKQDELIKINDKYTRMRQILKELNLPSVGFKPLELGADELPELVLEVKKEEIQVPKFINDNDEKKSMQQKVLEKDRMKSNQDHDDSRARALQVMMRGTLEVEETKNLFVCNVPKPECMDTKPKSEWTEDEKKLVKEYEKKLATVKEEQEKYKKSLETELRKCETGVEEIKQAFEVKLEAFLEEKHHTDNLLRQAELRMLFIARRISCSKKAQATLKSLKKESSDLKTALKTALEALPELKVKMDKEKENCDPLLKKEKELEKQLKKECAHATVPIETILKLYRKRAKTVDGTTTQVNLEESDWIAGFTPSQWHLLNEYRGKRIQLETEVKAALSKMETAKHNFECAHLHVEELQRQCDTSVAKVNEFETHLFQSAFNLEDLWHLKQAQVEVPVSPVVTDYSKAVLIHKHQVESLNQVISSLGQQKLEALKEMKDYRKGILALQWEIKVLDFQIEDVQLKIRDIQLLRVTKHMQEYIRSGNEGGSANLVTTLEKQLAYSESALQRKLQEQQRQYTQLEMQIQEKKKHNRQLSAILKELEAISHEREIIVQKRPKAEDTSGGHFASIAKLKRMEHLAHDQAKDINLLTSEVERWRLKTYPTFPSSSSSQDDGGLRSTTPSPTHENEALPPLTPKPRY